MPAPENPNRVTEAWFSPHDDCAGRIVNLLGETGTHADLCVFTITDDRISSAILSAHARGVRLRIVTDNDKAYDLGSDIQRFIAAGIAVRVDRTPYHMHHKFAIFDHEVLLTGSYNWTRGAADNNEENLILSNDRRLLTAFQGEFERLCKKFAPNRLA